MTKLINTFHDTYVITGLTREDIDATLDKHPGMRSSIERGWVLSVQNKLCGIEGCCCGNELGESVH